MRGPDVTEDALQMVNLETAAEELLSTAHAARARRAASTLYGGRDLILRQTAIALLADAELAEHDSPLEATLHVLRGRIVLHGVDREWELATGDLIPIPPERHSVRALEDSVFLLTVIRAAGG